VRVFYCLEKTMRAYFASLSDYNNGLLHGVWIELDGLDETEIQDEINAMLRQSRYPNVTYTCAECEGRATRLVESCVSDEREPCPHCAGKGTYESAEEWSIHDYDDMPDMGENPSLESLVEYVRMKDEHGDAWDAYLECVGANYATESDFQEKYAGEADTELAWVENWIEETGLLHGVDETLARYFDNEAYLRDMKAGGDISFERVDGTVYAFWA
jgi:antirestriction protein